MTKNTSRKNDEKFIFFTAETQSIRIRVRLCSRDIAAENTADTMNVNGLDTIPPPMTRRNSIN